MKFNSAPQLLIELPSRYSIYKRVFLLALTLVIALTTVYVWVSSHLSMNTHYYSQANTLGEGIAKQYQHILTHHVANKDFERINTVLEAAVNDPNVIAASVFDEFGQVIAQNPQYFDFVALHRAEHTPSPLTFVQTLSINNEGKRQEIGYVRMVMKAEMADANSAKMEHAFFQRTLVITALALIIGIILTRAFYKWRMQSHNTPTASKR